MPQPDAVYQVANRPAQDQAQRDTGQFIRCLQRLIEPDHPGRNHERQHGKKPARIGKQPKHRAGIGNVRQLKPRIERRKNVLRIQGHILQDQPFADLVDDENRQREFVDKGGVGSGLFCIHPAIVLKMGTKKIPLHIYKGIFTQTREEKCLI